MTWLKMSIFFMGNGLRGFLLFYGTRGPFSASLIPAQSPSNLPASRHVRRPHPSERIAMKNVLALIFAALVGLTGLAGCNNGGTKQNSTNMRTLNAVVDAEP